MNTRVANSVAKTASLLPANWERTREIYTCDDVIDAYTMGVQNGQKVVVSSLKKKFANNLLKATQLCEEVVKYLSTSDIICFSARIKPTPPNRFESSIIISQEDFLSDKFDKVYDLTHDISLSNESATFTIYFHFVPKTSHLNERRLVADGYILSYSPDGKK